MKKIISILAVSLMVLALVGCGNKGLEGKWKRSDSGSSLDGTIIEVTKTNDGYQATISELSEKAKTLGYNVGDIKWKEVKELNKGVWEFKDLGKTINKATTWYDMNVEFDESNKDILKAKDVASNNEAGSVQTWERVK